MSGEAGFSPIFITATVSITALLLVAVWQIVSAVQGRSAPVSYTTEIASSTGADGAEDNQVVAGVGTTPIGSALLDGLVAKYLSLQDKGLYTPEAGAAEAQKMAETLEAPISFKLYTKADITTSADTSHARMLSYRADLQTSLAPLLKNTQPEYEIFAYYVSTKDKKNLEKLRSVAEDYRAAVSATAEVIPPKDALLQHLGILNAMGEFSATLDGLAANADDPFASVVLLRSYNGAEADVLAAFQALATYYREKQS